MLLTRSISGQRYRVKSSIMRAPLFLTLPLPPLLKYRLKYIKLHRALNVATTLGHHTLPPNSNQFTLDKVIQLIQKNTQFKLNPSHPIPSLPQPFPHYYPFHSLYLNPPPTERTNRPIRNQTDLLITPPAKRVSTRKRVLNNIVRLKQNRAPGIFAHSLKPSCRWLLRESWQRDQRRRWWEISSWGMRDEI